MRQNDENDVLLEKRRKIRKRFHLAEVECARKLTQKNQQTIEIGKNERNY